MDMSYEAIESRISEALLQWVAIREWTNPSIGT